jgi:hypothetical protein
MNKIFWSFIARYTAMFFAGVGLLAIADMFGTALPEWRTTAIFTAGILFGSFHDYTTRIHELWLSTEGKAHAQSYK